MIYVLNSEVLDDISGKYAKTSSGQMIQIQKIDVLL